MKAFICYQGQPSKLFELGFIISLWLNQPQEQPLEAASWLSPCFTILTWFRRFSSPHKSPPMQAFVLVTFFNLKIIPLCLSESLKSGHRYRPKIYRNSEKEAIGNIKKCRNRFVKPSVVKYRWKVPVSQMWDISNLQPNIIHS